MDRQQLELSTLKPLAGFSFRKLLRQALIYGLGTVGSGLLTLALVPLLTRYLSPAEYGKLALANVLLALLVTIFPLGLPNALAKKYFDRPDVAWRQAVVRTSLLGIALSGLACTLFLAPWSSGLARLSFGTARAGPLILLVVGSAFFAGFFQGMQSYYRITEQARTFVWTQILRLGLTLILSAVLVVLLKQGVKGALLAPLTASAVVVLGGAPFILRGMGLTVSPHRLRVLLRFGVPFVPAALALWSLALVDRYFLQVYTGLKAVGLYTLGCQLALPILPVLAAFQLAWPPLFYRIAGQREAPLIYARVFRYFFLVIALWTLGIVLFAADVLHWLTRPDYWAAQQVVPWIGLGHLFFGCYLVLSMGITLAEKTAYLPLVTCGTAGFNALLNGLFIPSYGMLGAALATALSYLALAAAVYSLSNHFYPIPFAFGRPVAALLSGGLIYTLAIWIHLQPWWLSLGLKLIFWVGYGVLLYRIGFDSQTEQAWFRQGLVRLWRPLVPAGSKQ